MKKLIIFILLFLISIPIVGCGRPSITLRVLDEQTKEPVEGAVAIAWWDSSHGLPGLTYHKTAEVAERVSGPDGKLTLPSFSTTTIPHIRVYKASYVGWDNFKIYRGYMFNNIKIEREIARVDFEYNSQDIYLERWDEGYSHISHMSFLTTIFPDDHEYIATGKSIFSREVNEYEMSFALKERKMLIQERKKGEK